jgi:hypothetical protein
MKIHVYWPTRILVINSFVLPPLLFSKEERKIVYSFTRLFLSFFTVWKFLYGTKRIVSSFRFSNFFTGLRVHDAKKLKRDHWNVVLGMISLQSPYNWKKDSISKLET